jgi:hypothetical protein
VALVPPAATLTEAGTVSDALLLASVRRDPADGAFCVRVTVQVLTPLGSRMAGLQATCETSTCASRMMVDVFELLPSVAVTIALWLLARPAAAVALKVAVVVPAATLTDAGTLSEALLLASVTLNPPVGALWVSVTAHVLTPPGPRMAELQATPESGEGTSRVMEAVCVLLPSVAVTDAFRLLVMEAAAVALKLAVVAPAATETEAGTVSRSRLLLTSVTLAPPLGAAWVSATVHVPIARALNPVGAHVRGRREGTLIDPLLADVKLRPFPCVSVPIWSES